MGFFPRHTKTRRSWLWFPPTPPSIPSLLHSPAHNLARVFSVCFLSALGVVQQPACSNSVMTITAGTHTHAHARSPRGETNYLSTGKLFCLVHPCFFFLPLSHQQMGHLMKSALPVPICVRNEFLHFSKSENLQWDRLKGRKPHCLVIFFLFLETKRGWPCLHPNRIWNSCNSQL